MLGGCKNLVEIFFILSLIKDYCLETQMLGSKYNCRSRYPQIKLTCVYCKDAKLLVFPNFKEAFTLLGMVVHTCNLNSPDAGQNVKF